jgi:hypothetical protein
MLSKLVKFQIPSLHGKSTVAGIVKRILPDGSLEVKAQLGGYYVIKPSEVINPPAANGAN